MSQEKVCRKPLKNLKELAEELKIPLLSLKGKVTASKNRPLPKLIRKGQTKNWYDEDDFKNWYFQANMNYKEELIKANTKLAQNPKVRFIGYGLKKGRALGTLKEVTDSQIIEMPVAENLMMGFAIGLSLKGYLPVVFIERMDFLMNAMDAMVNHLDKIAKISHGEFHPKVIIRCIVGNTKKPLYTGATHTQDLTEGIRQMVSFPVWKLKDEGDIEVFYDLASKTFDSVMLVEYKDLA